MRGVHLLNEGHRGEGVSHRLLPVLVVDVGMGEYTGRKRQQSDKKRRFDSLGPFVVVQRLKLARYLMMA